MEIFFTVRENNEMKHHVTASSQQQHWSPALDPFEWRCEKKKKHRRRRTERVLVVAVWVRATWPQMHFVIR